jgi:glycosyltransferase involved in cell wall biosynthesis
MTTKVSVLLPVFNGEKTVAQAIKSIKAQTIKNWDLIIVDDGSQDNSYPICASEAKSDQRIILLRNQNNLGLARSMNKMVQRATGKYIAVQEQDDYSLPDRLKQEVGILDKHPEVGIVSGVAKWVNHQGQCLAYFPGLLHKGGQYPQDDQAMVRYLYTEQCKVVNAAAMIRREVLEKVDGPFDPDAKMSIDWQFFIHAAHFTKIWGIPEILVTMLRDPSHGHLTQQKELQFAEARRCIKIIYEKYKNEPVSPINKHLYRKAMLTELLLESKYYGRFKGLKLLFNAMIYGFFDQKFWRLVGWYLERGLDKVGLYRKMANGES